MNTDQIRKQVLLKSSIERAWQAVSDAASFGAWFGVEFDGPFVAGVQMNGRVVPTKVDPEIARLQEPHTGKPFQILVEEVTPMITPVNQRLLSRLVWLRWTAGRN